MTQMKLLRPKLVCKWRKKMCRRSKWLITIKSKKYSRFSMKLKLRNKYNLPQSKDLLMIMQMMTLQLMKKRKKRFMKQTKYAWNNKYQLKFNKKIKGFILQKSRSLLRQKATLLITTILQKIMKISSNNYVRLRKLLKLLDLNKKRSQLK